MSLIGHQNYLQWSVTKYFCIETKCKKEGFTTRWIYQIAHIDKNMDSAHKQDTIDVSIL